VGEATVEATRAKAVTTADAMVDGSVKVGVRVQAAREEETVGRAVGAVVVAAGTAALLAVARVKMEGCAAVEVMDGAIRVVLEAEASAHRRPNTHYNGRLYH
jgi:hypothetical protein